MHKILRIVLLIALSINVFFLQAQNVDVKMGEEMKVGGANTKLFGSDKEGNYYVMLLDGIKNSFFLKYGKNNQLITKVEANLSFLKGTDHQYTDFIVSNDKVFLIISKSDKISQSVFAHEVNKKTLAIDQKGIKLGIFPFVARPWDLEVNLIPSPDTSKFLLSSNSMDTKIDFVAIPIKTKTSNKLVNYKCYALDANMKLLNEYKGNLPYTNFIFSMYEQIISNEGEVYFLGSFRDKSIDKKEDRIKEVVIKVNAGSGHKIYKIELSGSKEPYRTAILNSNDKDKLIVTGFYHDKENSVQKGGSFYMVLDRNSGNILTEKSFMFDATIGASFLNERKRDKEDLEQVRIPKLVFRDIFYTKEGNTYIFAEDFNVFTKTFTSTYTTGSGAVRTKTNVVTYMTSENILMFCYDKNGQLIKQNAIKRSMTEEYTANLKYNQSTFGTFYNEENNSFYLNYYKSWGLREMAVVSLKVDSDLNIGEEQEVLDSRDEKVIFSPRLNCRVSPNEMVVLFYFKRHQQFAKFLFK